MESIGIIQYKWDCGIYDLKAMVRLVEDKVINKDQFFDITRYSFNGVVDLMSQLS